MRKGVNIILYIYYLSKPIRYKIEIILNAYL